MKKFKWLSLVLSIFMCFSLFCLTACNTGELKDPNSVGGDSGSEDSSGGSGSEDSSGGGSSEEPSYDKVDTADYIGGITIVYRPNQEDDTSINPQFNDGITEAKMTFNQLVDRQISMLSDDILNRLSGLYGQNYLAGMTGGVMINDAEKNDVKLKSNGAYAMYLAYDALSSYDVDNKAYYYDNGDNATTYTNLEEIESWAVAANSIIQGEESALAPTAGTILSDSDSSNHIIKNFSFKNAIVGSGFKISGETVSLSDSSELQCIYTEVSSTPVVARAWNWTIPASNSVSQMDYLDAYRNKLRMALSSVLSGQPIDKTSDYAFDQTTYNANISNIEHIGLLSYDQEIIKNLIKQVIIGEENVKYDNEIVELFAEHGVNVNNFEGFDFELAAEDFVGKDDAFITEYAALRTNVYNKMHFYKAYELVVDAIMERIVSNNFDETTKVLYPQMPRLAAESFSWDIVNEGQDGDFFKISSAMGNIKNIIFTPCNLMQYHAGLFFIESLTEANSFYADVNIKFVANSVVYKKDLKIDEIKIGANDMGAGIDNSFNVDMEGAVNVNDPTDVIDNYEKTPIWNANNGQGIEDINTFNNPFIMSQTDTVSTLVNVNAGNNYLELAFQFYTDEDRQNVYPGVPEYKLGIWGGITFEYDSDKLQGAV